MTPTLNRDAMLADAIASVNAQSYPRIEHIVVDGGSSDETLDILRRSESTGRLRWTSEPDGGMYQAINKGLASAAGEILCYLNSDDLYFPWTIEVVERAFRANPKIDLVIGDVLAIDQERESQRIHWQPPFDLDYVRRSGFLAQPGVFWRRRLMDEEGRFDESLKYVADCDYWMRVGSRHGFMKVNELLAIERDHPTTLRHQSAAQLADELQAVRSRYVQLGGLRDRLLKTRHRVRFALWRRRYWMTLLAGGLVKALRRSWVRFLADPRTRVSYRWAAALLFPRVGKVIEHRVLEGSGWVPEARR